MDTIVYVVGGIWTSHPGLVDKISNATKVWETLGLKVIILSPAEGKLFYTHVKELKSAPNEDFKRLGIYYDDSINKIRRFLSLRHQHRFIKKTLLELKPDIVYTRYALPFPGLSKAMGAASPYVIEINSDDVAEYGIKSKATGLYNILFRKPFIKSASGLCFISKELEKSNSFSSGTYKRVTIPNSIRVDSYPFIPHTHNQEPNIVFIGSPNQAWHGLDKIYLLSRHRPCWKFHIIGTDKVISDKKISSNIIFYGHLGREDAKSLVSGMDVGISTIALHRKGMNEASPLKSRQYAAQGIPFISGYKDTAISDVDFVLRLPNNETNIENNLASIDAFVMKAFLNSALRCQARRYAERHFDSEIVERERANFIMSCA